MKKNTTGQVIGVQMISATDGSAFTGTVTAYVTGDGGTQNAGSGTVTHKGNGYHSYAPTQAETNYDHIAFTFTGSGAVPVTVQVYTSFPQTGDSYARLGAPTGASVSADIASVKSKTDNLPANPAATSDIPSAASVADAVWDEATAGHVTAGTFAVAVTDILDDTGTSGVVVAAGSKTGYSLAADQSGVTIGTVNALGAQAKADVNAEVDAALDTAIPVTPTADSINERIKAIDDKLPAGTISDFDSSVDTVAVGIGGISSTSFAASAIDSAALAQSAGQEIADEVLNRNLAGGGSGDTRNVRNALRVLRNKASVSGGVLTVYQENDVSTAWTATVTTTAGDPISEVDPT